MSVPDSVPDDVAKPSILFVSGSPRHRKLLEQLGLREGVDFLMVPPGLEPAPASAETGRLGLRAAREKAIFAAREKVRRTTSDFCRTFPAFHLRHAVAVGVHTIGLCADRLLDHPPLQTRESARHMLKQRNGNTLVIVTGMVAALADDPSKECSVSVVTRLFARALGDPDIERYLATGEPFDTDAAFGIQARGTILFERIEGSYSNVVGLPLAEFYLLLHNDLFAGRVHFRPGPTDASRVKPRSSLVPKLSIVSLGIIPAMKTVARTVRDRAEEKALSFALAARESGFGRCRVLGSLSTDEGRPAGSRASEADLFYLSGYCLTGARRGAAVLEMLESVKLTGGTTVLDVGPRMSENITFEELCSLARGRADGGPLVDVLVGEVQEVLPWLGMADAPAGGDALADFLLQHAVPMLRDHFELILLRSRRHSREIVVSPGGASVESLDCAGLSDERLTAQRLHEYLSPRILLASRSPQRLALLRQLAAANKIEVCAADHPEDFFARESPKDRVVRLAREKAAAMLGKNRVSADIEVVVAADTEVVVPGKDGQSDVVAHPRTRDEAIAALRQLSGKTHRVMTGVAVVGADREAAYRRPRILSECVSTSVRFRRLSKTEILDYADSGECFGRAGAYAIQGRGAVLVEKIDGSYSNVVGLPLERLAGILEREFDLPVWDLNAVSGWKLPRRLKDALD